LDQEGVIVIPKAGRPECQKANLDALGISLDDEDRAAIAVLPLKIERSFAGPGFSLAVLCVTSIRERNRRMTYG
jgi:2,5-diketo-D-gluconate reductase B